MIVEDVLLDNLECYEIGEEILERILDFEEIHF